MSVISQETSVNASGLKDVFVETVVNAVPKGMRGKLCGSYLTSKIDFQAINNPFISHYEEVDKFLREATTFIGLENVRTLTNEQIEQIIEKLDLREDVIDALKDPKLDETPLAKTMILAFEAARLDPRDPEMRRIRGVARKFFVAFTASYLGALSKKDIWMEKAFPKMFDQLEKLERRLTENLIAE